MLYQQTISNYKHTTHGAVSCESVILLSNPDLQKRIIELDAMPWLQRQAHLKIIKQNAIQIFKSAIVARYLGISIFCVLSLAGIILLPFLPIAAVFDARQSRKRLFRKHDIPNGSKECFAQELKEFLENPDFAHTNLSFKQVYLKALLGLSG